MKYKTNHKKFSVKGRGEYMTKAEFICEYYTNIDKCREWFLNILVSNLNKMLLGVFHGINKRMLPLYFAEYEWRFNHRNTKNILDKVTKYIRSSFIARKKDIQAAMDVYALQRGLSLA